VCFPTRVQNHSATAVDNIFSSTSEFENYVISPLCNRLPSLDTRLLVLNDVDFKIPDVKPKTMGNINNCTMCDFQIKFIFETCDSTFDNNDVNINFNSFRITYLRIFYSSFPLKDSNSNTNINAWIALGTRTFCKRKRDLYLLCRNSNEPMQKNYTVKFW
jgi:hypothetical protein